MTKQKKKFKVIIFFHITILYITLYNSYVKSISIILKPGVHVGLINSYNQSASENSKLINNSQRKKETKV